MKILLYTHPFAPMVGGVETYTMLLARELAACSPSNCQDRIEVTVVTQAAAKGMDDAPLPFQVVRQPSIFDLWRRLGEADILHLAGPAFLPLLLGLLRGKPVVVEHHGYPPVCPNGLLFYEPTRSACPGHFMARRYAHCLRCNAATVGPLKSLLMLLATFPRRWMCKRVASNLAITQHVQDRLQLPRSKTVYYGIEDPLSSQCTEAGSAATPSEIQAPVVFAYVGRLVGAKGLSFLVEAAKRLKDAAYSFRLKFIGGGPERPRLERLAQKLDVVDNIQFTGFLTGAAMVAATADVAAVVIPSLWEETAGLAAIEQMMRGGLVIAADIGGLGEAVDGTGLKFPPGDVEALTACMKQVLERPELIREIGAAARARALSIFRREQMVDQHWQLYQQLGAANVGERE